MTNKFNIDDTVYYYEDNSKDIIVFNNGRIVESNLDEYIKSVFSAVVEEVRLTKGYNEYVLTFYEVYGERKRVVKKENELFESVKACMENKINTLKADLNNILKKLDEVIDPTAEKRWLADRYKNNFGK